METIKNRAVWGALIVDNRENINEVQRWLETLKRKVGVAKHHHDLIPLVEVMHSTIHNVHLSLWLCRLAPNKQIQPQMQLREAGVGSDEIGLIL